VLPRKPKRVTWAHVFAARVGIRRAARVLSFIATWAGQEADLGREISIEEYAEYWGTSLATAYRDLALFREAQPFFEHPHGFIVSVGTDPASVVPARFRGELA
jgi:hypothetical protein